MKIASSVLLPLGSLKTRLVGREVDSNTGKVDKTRWGFRGSGGNRSPHLKQVTPSTSTKGPEAKESELVDTCLR
jgi:hypothetical protein